MSSATDLAQEDCLEIATDVCDRVVSVRLQGALHRSTSPLVRRSLETALLSKADSLLLDLAGLRRMEPVCGAIVKQAAVEARALGVRFALVAPSTPVIEVLFRLGVYRRVPLLRHESDVQHWL